MLHGRDSAELLEDLRDAPLRALHRRAIVPHEAQWEDGTLSIRPREPLPPGTSFLLAVPAWARRADGSRWDTPWVTALQVASHAAGAPSGQSWPAEGTAGVPPSVPWVAVRFEDLVRLPSPETLSLRDDEGRRIPTRLRSTPCQRIGWPSGWCWRLEPLAPLQPSSGYRIGLDGNATDRFGEPPPPFETSFWTGTGASPLGSPEPMSIACALDERPVTAGCLLRSEQWATLRVRFTGPVRLFWRLGDRLTARVAPRGEALLRIELPSDAAPLDSSLRAHGLVGDPWHGGIPLPSRPDLLPLSIVEVRSDPLGTEPDQEYVELLHFGTEAISLRGVCLSDAADREGDCIEHDIILPPGGRVLLVSDRFDPRDTEDAPPVPPGVPLVRLGASLGRSGLSNRGEPLFLRDAAVRRLSAAPALPPSAPGRCVVRVADDPRRGDPTAFRADAPCSPGVPGTREAP